jgi:hypothetical protein
MHRVSDRVGPVYDLRLAPYPVLPSASLDSVGLENPDIIHWEGILTVTQDAARLSPFLHERHINLLGRYSFAVPEAVTRGELRPLRDPNDAEA